MTFFMITIYFDIQKAAHAEMRFNTLYSAKSLYSTKASCGAIAPGGVKTPKGVTTPYGVEALDNVKISMMQKHLRKIPMRDAKYIGYLFDVLGCIHAEYIPYSTRSPVGAKAPCGVKTLCSAQALSGARAPDSTKVPQGAEALRDEKTYALKDSHIIFHCSFIENPMMENRLVWLKEKLQFGRIHECGVDPSLPETRSWEQINCAHFMQAGKRVYSITDPTEVYLCTSFLWQWTQRKQRVLTALQMLAFKCMQKKYPTILPEELHELYTACEYKTAYTTTEVYQSLQKQGPHPIPYSLLRKNIQTKNIPLCDATVPYSITTPSGACAPTGAKAPCDVKTLCSVKTPGDVKAHTRKETERFFVSYQQKELFFDIHPDLLQMQSDALCSSDILPIANGVQPTTREEVFQYTLGPNNSVWDKDFQKLTSCQQENLNHFCDETIMDPVENLPHMHPERYTLQLLQRQKVYIQPEDMYLKYLIQIQTNQYFTKKETYDTKRYLAEPKIHKDILQYNNTSQCASTLRCKSTLHCEDTSECESPLQCNDIQLYKNEKKKRMQRKHLRALYRQRGWEPTPIITDEYVRQYSGFKPERTF